MERMPVDGWTRADRDRARAILLESSPIPADGGELVGRDPKTISADDLTAAGIDPAPVLSAIRAKCLDCSGENTAEARKCVAVACALWPYRMGSNPFRAKVEMSDERRAAAAERLAAVRRPAKISTP